MRKEYVSRSFHSDYGTCYRCGKPCDHTSITIIKNGEGKKLCNACFDEVFDSIKPLAAKATSDKAASDKPLTIEESKYQMRKDAAEISKGVEDMSKSVVCRRCGKEFEQENPYTLLCPDCFEALVALGERPSSKVTNWLYGATSFWRRLLLYLRASRHTAKLGLPRRSIFALCMTGNRAEQERKAMRDKAIGEMQSQRGALENSWGRKA